MSIRINGNNKIAFPIINKETLREIYINTGITVRNRTGMAQRIVLIAITTRTTPIFEKEDDTNINRLIIKEYVAPKEYFESRYLSLLNILINQDMQHFTGNLKRLQTQPVQHLSNFIFGIPYNLFLSG